LDPEAYSERESGYVRRTAHPRLTIVQGSWLFQLHTDSGRLRCYGGVPEEWCFGVQRDVCDSSFEVRIIRGHRSFGDVFYAVCIHCL